MTIFDPKTNTLLQKLLKLDADEQFVEGDIEAFFENPGLWRQLHTRVLKPEQVVIDRRSWMTLVFQHMGCRSYAPELPHINGKQQRALERFNFQILYSKYMYRSDFPESFQFPDDQMGHYAHSLPISDHCWVAVENVTLPRARGSGYQNDRLCEELGLESRLGLSWEQVDEQIIPIIAARMGFPMQRVRLMSWAEWNFFGNLLNEIQWQVGEKIIPFVGRWGRNDSDVVEWCQNRWDPRIDKDTEVKGRRSGPGYTCMGSLNKVTNSASLPSNNRIGFRIIIQLTPEPGEHLRNP